MKNSDKQNKTIIDRIIQDVIILVVGSLIVYGVTQRPLVDCHIDSLNAHYLYFGKTEDIAVYVQNRGPTDAPVTVHLTGENVTFIEMDHKPYLKLDWSEARFYTTLPKEMDGPNQVTFYFEITEGAEEVCIKCSVDKRFELTPTGMFNYFFGEVREYDPIECKYNKTGTSQYTLIT